MKTVQITLNIEVPDDCEQFAMGEDGKIIGFSGGAIPTPYKWSWAIGNVGCVRLGHILNWRDTLTEVE